MIRDIIATVLFILGITSVMIGISGVFRFRFVMNRMHCAALIDTFGLMFILAGLMVLSGSVEYIPKLLLVLVFQWVGSPIASHMVGRLEVRTDKSIGEHLAIEHEETEETEA